MKILILYATTEGQTRKIARSVQRQISQHGHTSELLSLDAADVAALAHHDAAVLLASVHAGQYQAALCTFVANHLAELRNLPHAFVSVSLSAAGRDPDDWAGLETCVEGLTKATGWTPEQVFHVAGAFKFSDYNWFKTWAMRWIASQKAIDVTSGEDIELTDWEALETDIASWLASLDT